MNTKDNEPEWPIFETAEMSDLFGKVTLPDKDVRIRARTQTPAQLRKVLENLETVLSAGFIEDDTRRPKRTHRRNLIREILAEKEAKES